MIEREHQQSSPSLNEALALSSLNHPNIVTVYDVGRNEDGSQFIVMELLDGKTLEDTIRSGTLPAEDLRKVAFQALSGLSGAHASGYLHRDLKPSNLMIVWPAGGRDYLTKILDFGLAKRTTTPNQQTVDHTGSILGSIHYMAPEQFEGAPLDTRTDLYQLGCTLYFAATGCPPANGDTTAQVMAAHLASRHQPLATLRPDLPDPLLAWINRLMARSPADRPSDASDALRCLPELIQERATTAAVPPAVNRIRTHPAPAPRQDKAQPSRPSGMRIAVAAGLIILIGIGVVMITGKTSATTDPDQSARVPESSASSSTQPVEPATPGPRGVPSPLPVASGDPGFPIIDPCDPAAVEANMGKTVTISGTIRSVGESRSGRTRYINLSASRDDLSIAIEVESIGHLHPMSTLRTSVGRRARATGRIRNVFGSPLLYIERSEQLEITE